MRRIVLLDVDGTLVDSNRIHAEAWVEAFRDAGFTPSVAEVARLIGMGGDQLVPAITGWPKGAAKIDDLGAARSALFLAKYVGRVRAWPRAQELLDRLLAAGHELAVATSASRDELVALAAAARLPLLADLPASTADDADKSKPHPDILQAALSKIDGAAPLAWLLGDTPYDVKAAKQAGVGRRRLARRRLLGRRPKRRILPVRRLRRSFAPL